MTLAHAPHAPHAVSHPFPAPHSHQPHYVAHDWGRSVPLTPPQETTAGGTPSPKGDASADRKRKDEEEEEEDAKAHACHEDNAAEGKAC